MDECPAGEELQTQLQPVFPAADSKEEGMVHTVRTEAQHQCQLPPQGGGKDIGCGGLQLGPLCEDEARWERNDTRGCGAPATPGLRPAEAQPLEDIHIWEGEEKMVRACSSLGYKQSPGNQLFPCRALP